MSNFPKAKKKLEEKINFYKEALSQIRSGRANSSLIEDINVEHYGTKQPVKALGSISTLDATTLVVEPWDKSALESIANAISKSQSGLQAVVDGERVRVPFPPLSQERRDEFIRHASKKAEEVKAQMRQLRDEEIKELKQQEKNGDIGEDTFFRTKEELEELFKEYFKKIDELKNAKEEDLRNV